ncbi:MAG: hypothetical protein JJE22_13830 [Bacteroidia bacterium]|nr:hypothetical protein [Bacteroidia bacterium]
MLKSKKTISKTFKEKTKLLASVEKGMKQVSQIEKGKLKSIALKQLLDTL